EGRGRTTERDNPDVRRGERCRERDQEAGNADESLRIPWLLSIGLWSERQRRSADGFSGTGGRSEIPARKRDRDLQRAYLRQQLAQPPRRLRRDLDED